MSLLVNQTTISPGSYCYSTGGGGGGGGVNPSGISTNQVATATGTGLNLVVDGTTAIVMESTKGGVINITSGSGTGSIGLVANSITTTPNCDLTISSINGLAPGGGGVAPSQSTIIFTGTSFPVTCSAGTTTPLANDYILTAGHTYTASFNFSYSMNTSDQNNALQIDFDAPGIGTSIGPVWTPPAFLNNATSSDGASIAISLTWTQFNTSVKGGVYITPSGTGYDAYINQIVGSGNDPRLVITDWGVL